jgi:hypothetical protein
VSKKSTSGNKVNTFKLRKINQELFLEMAFTTAFSLRRRRKNSFISNFRVFTNTNNRKRDET